MTIDQTVWTTNDLVDVTATITFKLPVDTNQTVTKERVCAVVINTGPDGTDATFVIVASGFGGNGGASKFTVQEETTTTVQPFGTYLVRVTGWSHKFEIFYSVWGYYTTDMTKKFRLSLDSNSTEHNIQIPAQTDTANFVLLVRATDELQYPHRDCSQCSMMPTIEQLSTAETTAKVAELVSKPVESVEEVISLLVNVARAPDLPSESADLFLQNIRNFLENTDRSVFLDQTAESWNSHLGSRTAVDTYDLQVVDLLDSIVSGSSNLTVNGLTGTVMVYGTVLRREALPTIEASRAVWGALAGAVSPSPIVVSPFAPPLP